MFTPLYEGHDSPRKPQKNLNSHKGLWYERFFNQYDSNWAVGETVKKIWIDNVAGLCGDPKVLKPHAVSQRMLCDNLHGISQIYKNNWHFVSGMGNDHPVENGMSWHPTLGTPYLSGASVKGLLRAWMEEWFDLEEGELKEKLYHWFGSDDKDPKKQQKDLQAGALIFFDAIPIEPVALTCDIMTPHMGKWYSNGAEIQNNNDKKEKKGNYSDTLPADWHNPIPIPFLVVKQANLQFSIAPRSHAKVSEEELQEVMDELKKALEYLGAGAKTAAGYGRFEKNNEENTRLKKAQKESLRNNMKPEDSFADKLKDIDDKKLAEMFGRNFKNTKESYEEKNCQWKSIIEILMADKRKIIVGWSEAEKNTAQSKAYNKLKSFL